MSEVAALDTGTAAQGATGTTIPPEGETGTRLYAGKYKTLEDMEKGYEEAQKLATREAQRAAEAERKARDSEMKAEIARQINEQAKLDAKANGTTIEEARARLKGEYAERLKDLDNLPDALIDLGERTAGAARKAMEDKSAELERKLSELHEQLADVQVISTPEYQENRNHIEVLAKTFGCSRKKALETFQAMAKEVTFAPVGAASPGSTAESRPSANAGKSVNLRHLNARERQMCVNMGWSSERIEKEMVAAD